MPRALLVVLCILITSSTAQARMLVREADPLKTDWKVQAVRSGTVTTFSFFIPFKGGALPPGTTATLEVHDVRGLVASSTLQLQSEGKKTFFRFSVATRLLDRSRFTLTRIDLPHPAGTMTRANLGKFARARDKDRR